MRKDKDRICKTFQWISVLVLYVTFPWFVRITFKSAKYRFVQPFQIVEPQRTKLMRSLFLECLIFSITNVHISIFHSFQTFLWWKFREASLFLSYFKVYFRFNKNSQTWTIQKALYCKFQLNDFLCDIFIVYRNSQI